jgi:serine/threonine protein phosphatase PrpC
MENQCVPHSISSLHDLSIYFAWYRFPIAMEDAHAHVLDLDQGKSETESNAFFAVYDGHGGMDCDCGALIGSVKLPH